MLADSDFRSSLASWKKRICTNINSQLSVYTPANIYRVSAMIHYPAQTGEMLVIDFLRNDPN